MSFESGYAVFVAGAGIGLLLLGLGVTLRLLADVYKDLRE